MLGTLFQVFKAASGPHWFRTAVVIGSGAYAAATAVDAAVLANGFSFLPTVPKAAFVLTSLLLLLLFWGWKRAYELHKAAEPKLEITFNDNSIQIGEEYVGSGFNAMIENVGGVPLTRCLIRLEISSSDGLQPRPALFISHAFPLGRKEPRIVPIFYVGGGEEGKNGTLVVTYFDPALQQFVGDRLQFGRCDHYDITIVASAAESEPARLSLTLTHKDGLWSAKKKAV